ncbi:TTAGGG repeat binding factor [Rhizina undulata]
METEDAGQPLQQGETQRQVEGETIVGQADQEHHHVDPSLSSIAAFNAAYNNQHSTATNEWGKRPAEESPVTEDGLAGNADLVSAKRQHLEPQEHVEEPTFVNIDVGVVAFPGDTTQESQTFEHHHHHLPVMEESVGLNGNGQLEEEEGSLEQEFELDDEEQERNSPGSSGWGPLNMMDPNSYMLWDANQNLRIQSLPILDNLSTQILTTLGKGPYQETLNIVTQPDSDQGQAYNTMKALFDQTKKLYTHEAFLSADELKLDLPEQRTTVRKVNLATFVSSVFGSQEVGFFHLNEHFLDTFVPDGGRLLKSQGALYLDLKTQAYISAMSTNERGKEEILTDLFPDEMKDFLLARRPGARHLTPSELDFVARLKQRRQHLMLIGDEVNLSEKYVWQEFLKDVSSYVSKNYESIIAQSMRKPRKRRSSTVQQRSVIQHSPRHHIPNQQSPIQHQDKSDEVDAATVAVLSAHNAVHNPQMQPQPASAARMALDAELFGSNTSIALSLGAPPLAQPPVSQQSAPTQVLYERARLAATAKASPNARRAGLPSQRRPWSSEEENALMAGLDRVKGPHWSQILAMFGPGGTVNEVLKDRNQVQLKDKARNLKLFFLKSGIEVPYYLQFVTGELKTRAPGQAAKHAAKKAAENSANEDAAHVNAVTVLGNVGNMHEVPRLDGHEQHDVDEMRGNVAPVADMGGGIGMQMEHGPGDLQQGVQVIEELQEGQEMQEGQAMQEGQEMQEGQAMRTDFEQPMVHANFGQSHMVEPQMEKVDGFMGVDPTLRGEISVEQVQAGVAGVAF